MFNLGTKYNENWLRTHAAIIGMTGSGKTGLGVVMMEEAARLGIPATIIDPKGDLTNLLDKQIGMDYKVYTPGDKSGIPVNILASLQTCDTKEKISSTVTALLGLAGINPDPLEKEHILISNILANQKVDMPALINTIQSPPFDRLGVMPLEQFYPEKKRYELSVKLNNFMAAPSFADWLVGEPIEFKNEHSIYYLNHLTDQEKMFFVTLLYTEVENWMRSQGGTEDLRRLVYFDEVAEYLPPVKTTPAKPVILRLLKQARAFGVGLILATQNPVDLDYKALSNIGTWMIGKLQTEQDKARLVEGIGDVNLSGLGNRKFLLHSIYQDDIVFKVRDAINRLSGPATLDELPDQEWNNTELEKIKVVPAVPSKYKVYYHGEGTYKGFIGGRAKVTYSKGELFFEKEISAIYNNGWDNFSLEITEPNGKDYEPLNIPDLKQKDFEDWIYKTQYIEVPYNKTLKMYDCDFDAEIEKERKKEHDELHEKYTAKIDKLKSRVNSTKMKMEEYHDRARGRKNEMLAQGLEIAVSMAAGRRRSLASPITKQRMYKEDQQRVIAQQEKLDFLKKEWRSTNDWLAEEQEKINDKWENAKNDVVMERIKPLKKDIVTELFGVIWIGGLNDSKRKENPEQGKNSQGD